jgi:hypothetical protein
MSPSGRVRPSAQKMDTAPRQIHGESRSRLLARLDEINPYWGPQIVVAAAIFIDLWLPKKLTIGPSWLLPSIEGFFLIVLSFGGPHPRFRRSPLRRSFAIALIALISLVNIVSLFLLIHYLLHVLLFGLWYWELDRGGPMERSTTGGGLPDFLFPQMTDQRWAPPGWMPGLVDYLYVSLTNATAFSPTDTLPLTPSAKWLMSAQCLASLVTVGLVVARAVNILT